MAEANGFDGEIERGTGHASLSQRSSSLKLELWWWGVMGEFHSLQRLGLYEATVHPRGPLRTRANPKPMQEASNQVTNGLSTADLSSKYLSRIDIA